MQQAGGDTAIRRNKGVSTKIGKRIKALRAKYDEGLAPWAQDPIMQVLGYDRLANRAEVVKSDFDSRVQTLIDLINRKLSKPLVAMKAGVKGKERGEKKCTVKYGGDAAQMSDMVRGTIVVDGDIDDLYRVVGFVTSSPLIKQRGAHWTHFADRYQKPLGQYYDILTLLRIDGFVCELQFNLESVAKVKESSDGHGYYEQERKASDDLLIAARDNDEALVKDALRRGAKPATKEDVHGISALHLLAYHGNEGMVRMLLDAGADPFCRDNRGLLPFHRPAQTGDKDTAKLLLERMGEVGLWADRLKGPSVLWYAEQAFEAKAYTAPAGPRAPAAGLRATRYIRLLEQARATRASPDY